MTALDPAAIGFRPLAERDLTLLHRWLNTPHVLEWWDKDMTLETVEAKYRPRLDPADSTRCFVITYDGRDVGFIQHYRLGLEREYAAALDLGEDAVAADLYIGDPELVHHGLGSEIVRRFYREVALPAHGLDVAIIAPSVRNRAAIRAYEKAGFRYVKTAVVPGEDDPEYVMRASREELAAVSG